MDSRSKRLIFATILLLIGSIAYGSYRFFIAHNYVLQYEASCDPISEQCFVYTCTEEDGVDCEPYTYKLMYKYAYDVRNACGTDVRDCAAATQCQPSDTLCTIEYCDPTVDECAGPNK